MTDMHYAGRMYRPPSKPPVTAWARHLDQVMRERAWSQTRLFEEVGRDLGYSPKSRTGFLPLLVDKEPSAAQVRVLEQHFGAPDPIEHAPERGASLPDVVALVQAMTDALRAQTQALADLRVDLATARESASQEREAMTQLLAGLGERLEAVEALASRSAGSVHPGSGR